MMTKEEHREAMYGLCIAHITSPAENRMRTRQAQEQLEEAKRLQESEQTAQSKEEDDNG